MSGIRVLIIDDLKEIRDLLSSGLKIFGYETESAESGDAALKLLTTKQYDVALLDIVMPRVNGIEVLKNIKKKSPALQVIMLTGHGSYSSVVECIKNGAYDYVSKPASVKDLASIIERAYREKQMEEPHVSNLKFKEEFKHDHYYGNNKKVREILTLIDEVAPTDSTVLICGETGTGKELIAKAIHAKSNRKDKPFVILNCAALQESLIESELFGHMQGAFTGASKEKRGIVEVADTGTLFLDEIGEMGMNLQTKLLRLLEAGDYRKVGGTEIKKADLRVIAATNRNLLVEVENGKFRKDLYYRLNIMMIEPPPLRDRKNDLPYLMLVFIKKFNKIFTKNVVKVSDEVIEIFERYEWPGNVRELENVLQSAMLVAKTDTISVSDLPGKFMEFIRSSHSKSTKKLAELEKEYILSVLKENDGNKLKTSNILGIDRTTLYKKLKEYGVQ